MTELLILFRNDNEAVEGEQKLLNAGIDVKMIPAPKTMGPGCGICLSLSPADLGKAKLLLGGSILEIWPKSET